MSDSLQGKGIRASQWLAAAVLAATCVVSGCGGGGGDGGAKPHAKAKPQSAAQAPQPVAVDDDPRYASAVVSGKTSAPVDLKYDLSAKPKVGEPFEVELVFQPRLPADTLEIEVTGMPGLVVGQQGAFKFEKVQAQTPYVQKVTLQADADGTYYINVIARMITQVQTEVRTFSVPVVLGTSPSVVAKPAPQKDAAGQPIEPMHATEPKQ
jgi:hypothetical protein